LIIDILVASIYIDCSSSYSRCQKSCHWNFM